MSPIKRQRRGAGSVPAHRHIHAGPPALRAIRLGHSIHSGRHPMPAPENRFKSRLPTGLTLYGCWAGFADPYPTEVLATAGFDWLVLDGEHAPNDLRSLMAQLQVLEGHDSAPVVRLPMGEAW